MTTTKISILGTGWLGLPLAQTLVAQGNRIKGATTSENKLDTLQQEGIQPYQIALTEKDPEGPIACFLEGSEILIINIPPGLRRNPNGNFIAKIENLIPHIEQSTIERVLFISSTSVFADQEDFPIITSETLPNATSNTGKQLIAVEQLLHNNTNFDTTVLRFAGLYDERRHPATMLSKRKGIKNPNAPVNLIHLDDCLGIIQRIIQTQNWNITYNAASPTHPPKAEYYSSICTQMGIPTPDYDFNTLSKGKVIDANPLVDLLAYTFTILL